MQRHGHDRRAGPVDAGLGVHPLAHAQSLLGELVQDAAGRVVGVRAQVGVADLAEDLLLADDERVESGGHGEEMLDGGLGVAHVGVPGHLVDGHARVVAEYLADRLESRVEGIDDGVDLDAVARRDDHGLGDRP